MVNKKQIMVQRQQKEMGNAIVITIELFVNIFMFILIILFTIVIVLIILIIFLISSIVKIISRTIKYKSEKKKLDKEIFVNTNFERKCIRGIRKSFDNLGNGSKNIWKDIKKLDKKNRRSWPKEDNGRYCEICGGRLGKGRVKYCSKCRPTYRSKPFQK